MTRNAAAPKTTMTTAAIIPPMIPPEDEPLPPLVDGCEEEDAEGKEEVILLDPVGNADVPLPIIDVAGCVSELFAVEVVDLWSLLLVSLAVDAADLWVVASALVVVFGSVVGFDSAFVVDAASFLVVSNKRRSSSVTITHVSSWNRLFIYFTFSFCWFFSSFHIVRHPQCVCRGKWSCQNRENQLATTARHGKRNGMKYI